MREPPFVEAEQLDPTFFFGRWSDDDDVESFILRTDFSCEYSVCYRALKEPFTMLDSAMVKRHAESGRLTQNITSYTLQRGVQPLLHLTLHKLNKSTSQLGLLLQRARNQLQQRCSASASHYMSGLICTESASRVLRHLRRRSGG